MYLNEKYNSISKCLLQRMHNIGVNEGYMVTVENITAQIGKYALFEPQVLNKYLPQYKFTCLN